MQLIEKNHQNLINTLNDECFFSDARRAKCETEYKNFVKQISNQPITRSNKSSYGRQPAFEVLHNSFSSILATYYEKIDQIKFEFMTYQVDANISNHVFDSSSAKHFSEALFKICKNLHWSADQIKQSRDFIYASEFIYLLAEIVSIISKFTEIPYYLAWCDFCFRIANPKYTTQPYSNFCWRCEEDPFVFTMASGRVKFFQLQTWKRNFQFSKLRYEENNLYIPKLTIQKIHFQVNKKRTKDKNFHTCLLHHSKKDTSYKRAQKRRKHLTVQDELQIKRSHAERRRCILKNDGHFPIKSMNSSLALFLNPENFIDKKWLTYEPIWRSFLCELVPDQDVKVSDTWIEFTNQFHELLENKNEDTCEPYWIFDIYCEAMIWKNLEEKHPMKKNNSLGKIVELFDKGKNVKEISIELQISESYIHRQIKFLGLSLIHPN